MTIKDIIKPCAIAILLSLLDIVCLFSGITFVSVACMLVLQKRWSWLMTPDVALPGDLNVPAVAALYQKWGSGPLAWYVTSWYWLAVRNRWHGLDFHFALPTSVVWPFVPGRYVNGHFWYWLIVCGDFAIKLGWRQYTVNGVRYNVPCFTVTKA